jgi:hypothetical protein
MIASKAQSFWARTLATAEVAIALYALGLSVWPILWARAFTCAGYRWYQYRYIAKSDVHADGVTFFVRIYRSSLEALANHDTSGFFSDALDDRNVYVYACGKSNITSSLKFRYQQIAQSLMFV